MSVISVTAKANSAAYEKSRVIKAAKGSLVTLHGYNSGAAQFLQIHDAAAVPADAAVPILTLAIAATASFSFSWPFGLPCANGIVVCNSSTGPTKTIGADDCYFTATYF